MTARHLSYASIAIALLAMVALGAFLLRPWGDRPLTAAEAASVVCTTLQTTHYDAVGVTRASGLTDSAEITIAGEDVRILTTITNAQGAIEGKTEQIYKDGVYYHRSSRPPGHTAYGSWRQVNNPGIVLDTALPCLNGSNVRVTGGFLAQSNTYHVVSNKTNEDGSTLRAEFWATAAGVPTNARNVVTIPELGVGGASGLSAQSSTTITTDYTISGIGQTNTITAPTMPTPTPTPTPTPLPAIVDRYDTNDDRIIDKNEYRQALNDYHSREITYAQLQEVRANYYRHR